MGLDITPLIVDWAHLESLPSEAREAALTESAYPDDEDQAFEEGWAWLPPTPPSWCARYDFSEGSGSFKPHFWAGQRWEDLREHVVDGLRIPLDTFLAGLFWDLSDTGPGDQDAAEPWRRRLLVHCPPQDVPALAQAWDVVGPEFGRLRRPFDTHAADPGRWAGTFEEFTAILHGWSEVVTEAHRRGWGLVGLPI
ncbi:hypothetical protein AB0K09_15850 [Streptomyces sp. NPDC049577]|uniref:hypothetical protein n=1 Tax=Streptomyces sp. NPDC049577 TaxID=3155153 RepID=UPI00341D4AB8